VNINGVNSMELARLVTQLASVSATSAPAEKATTQAMTVGGVTL
jgi:predicted flavoprotein YhiN